VGALVVTAQMTIDGVLDSIEHWFHPDEHSDRQGLEQLAAADALLLGRKTFEGLRGHWIDKPGDGGWASLVNAIPKYVVSRTLTGTLDWNATLLTGELAESVRAVKAEHNLLSYGMGELAHQLATQGIADEFRFWVHPAVWGGDGARPFAGLGLVSFDLTSSTTFASGITLDCYRPIPAGK
jgi:dihydrofolate reductase